MWRGTRCQIHEVPGTTAFRPLAPSCKLKRRSNKIPGVIYQKVMQRPGDLPSALSCTRLFAFFERTKVPNSRGPRYRRFPAFSSPSAVSWSRPRVKCKPFHWSTRGWLNPTHPPQRENASLSGKNVPLSGKNASLSGGEICSSAQTFTRSQAPFFSLGRILLES